MQSTSATAPAPTPAVSLETKAIELLANDIEESKRRGDEWLAESELMKVAHVFRGDSKSAEIYIAFAKGSKSASRSREWIRNLL
jgi:hypothetical protein